MFFFFFFLRNPRAFRFRPDTVPLLVSEQPGLYQELNSVCLKRSGSVLE